MVDLQISIGEFRVAYRAFAIVCFNDLFLEIFRESYSSTDPVVPDVRWITKTESGDFPAIAVFCPKPFKRKTLLSHVANCSRRVFVTVVFNILRGNAPVFQDVLNHNPRPFAGDELNFTQDFFGDA